MKLVQFIDFLIQRKRTVLRLCYAVLALLVIWDAIPFFVNKEHAHTDFETIPGFWAVFGLVGCMFLILISKAFGHTGVMKGEDYYNE
ncbi:MAG: hypothetical protein SFY80_13430 [Verrucomicrobiota bacterium]|nr:hypothetical protein [Verrucomicrobiota bacterium]